MSITKQEVGEIVHQMMDADLEQLRTMNKICVQQIKEKRKKKIEKKKSLLTEGMVVVIRGGSIDGQKGVISNVKRTRANVVVNGSGWDVPILHIEIPDDDSIFGSSDDIKDPSEVDIEIVNPEDL